ncbi:radical SAM/SPASM domain-containing protein [Nostoc sp. RF31YmG]|nr:radical SAM/SPASM domain-containing protein [Nostoc sp. RF31YmG]
MKKTPLVIKHFKEQHYSTFFNPNTGFFARIEEPEHDEPFWSWHGPELLDISITNWCDKGCALCYRKSDESGHHMSVEDYEEVIRQAQQMHVFQVALGGGNPNQHPNFCEILCLTREKYGIVPNYTTNGRGLTGDVLEATKKYCGAVAVSAYSPYKETQEAIDVLLSYGIKTNIHFILSSESINTAIDWFEKPPSFLNKINALIFLNYKPVGRYYSHKLLLKNSNRVKEFFQLATEKKHSFKIGFDTCTVTGIARFTKTPDICYEGCDAGRFSMFVSEDMKMYPCSFMVEAGYEGVPIVESNMKDFWQNGEPFQRIRNQLGSGGCVGCQKASLCLGGCPLFPEINLCPEQ